MINRKLKIGIFVLALVFLTVCCSRQTGAAESVGLEFEVPPPENSEAIGAPSLRLFNTDFKGATYKSQENIYRVAAFYNNFFAQAGFNKTQDAPIKAGSNVHRLQFRKHNLVVDIALTSKPDGAEVGIAKYMLDEKVNKLEDMPLSVNDSIFMLPQADMPGEDLGSIPRPPSSVRIASMKVGTMEIVTYTTKTPLLELRQFYMDEMTHGEWQPKSNIDMAALTANYKKVTGKSDLGLGKAKFPIQGSRNLEEVATQGYILEFTGGAKESVRISLLPGFFGRNPDNIVQIAYTPENYERK
ncbi:MAG: hypothetical protein PHI86_06245 [Candidatus Omnitrophica bacterium]|nr:hypothetical protein [Candidatus Omnitrophota bacterium]HOX54292.1 hypothetical protein [Candidatus Omnitrophota bacterium]